MNDKTPTGLDTETGTPDEQTGQSPPVDPTPTGSQRPRKPRRPQRSGDRESVPPSSHDPNHTDHTTVQDQDDSLTSTERETLAELETRIEDALEGMLHVAVALRAINGDRLYREEYPTFAAYCKGRWGKTARWGHYHVAWAALDEGLAARGHARRPGSEAVARPLAEVSLDGADAVWTIILKRREGPLDSTKAITSNEVADEVASWKEAEAGALAEDGEGPATKDRPPITIPGHSPLVERHGRIAATPPPVVKDKVGVNELLVSVPGTLFERPTWKHHLVDAGLLPEPLSADYIAALTDEARRIGVTPTFHETNASVDWAKYTWGVVTGCVHGCEFCYARSMSILYFEQGFTPTFHPARLLAPETTVPPAGVPPDDWQRRVFVASMGDLFAKTCPKDVVQAVLDAMRRSPQWTFLVLTKNPNGLVGWDFPDNVWVGCSVVTQSNVAAAETAMQKVNATVKWVSIEPLLGSVRFTRPEIFDWFVIGSQTRTAQVKAIQPDDEWVWSLLIQAHGAGVKVFMKENLDFHLRESPTARDTPAAPRTAPDRDPLPSQSKKEGSEKVNTEEDKEERG